MGGASLLVQLHLLPINVTLATVSPIKCYQPWPHSLHTCLNVQLLKMISTEKRFTPCVTFCACSTWSLCQPVNTTAQSSVSNTHFPSVCFLTLLASVCPSSLVPKLTCPLLPYPSSLFSTITCHLILLIRTYLTSNCPSHFHWSSSFPTDVLYLFLLPIPPCTHRAQ